MLPQNRCWNKPGGGLISVSPLLVQSAICVLLATAPFVFGLSGGFLFDDWANIVRNTSLHLASSPNVDALLHAAYSFEPGGGSRPLSMLSFSLDFWRAGLDPSAFKLTNLLIHGLSTLVLVFFFCQLLRLSGWSARHSKEGALLMALFWALHPLQVSSVLYIVQRMQTLGTLFLFLAMWAYLHMRSAQIEGKSGRLYGISTLLFWVLAFAAKEDSVLLPVYTLILEVILLQFRADNSVLVERWRRLYAILFLLSLLVYFFYVVPHYWHWQNYPGRDFSTPERLLTQGRVLIMYLAQVFLPFSNLMHFFYDDLEVSRGLFQPIDTLPALVGIFVLLGWGWHWRRARPLFSIGILFFFAGHLITSNVIGLELAFEHRNHFPLVGLVLASGDLLSLFFQRFKIGDYWRVFFVGTLLVSLAWVTAGRAHIWGDNLRLAQSLLYSAPDSERAWVFLSAAYFERSKQNINSPDLEKAISACENGMQRLPKSAVLANNLLIFKSVQGRETQEDWMKFLERLDQVSISPQNKGVLWMILGNAERGLLKNENGVLRVIEIVSEKTGLKSTEYLRIAAYVFNQTSQPEKAYPYLQRAVESASTDDPSIRKMLGELVLLGRKDWVDELQRIQK